MGFLFLGTSDKVHSALGLGLCRACLGAALVLWCPNLGVGRPQERRAPLFCQDASCPELGQLDQMSGGGSQCTPGKGSMVFRELSRPAALLATVPDRGIQSLWVS